MTGTKLISGHEDFSDDPYQLLIIVKDSKDFTAEQLVTMVATSVTDFAPVSQDAAERGENWELWLAGRFRKVVKRLKPSLYSTLSKNLSEMSVEHFVCYGDVDLIVIAPQRKSFAPAFLKRAQVSGLSVVEAPLPEETEASTMVMVNTDVEMSVPKMAVAAAHALQMTKQVAYDSNSKSLADWSPSQAGFVWIALDDDNAEYTVEVVDAGLTEVIPGSMTAASIVR